jgi:hypothetical protein
MEEKNATIELFEEWGAVKALRETLLVLGEERFGSPTVTQKQSLDGIEDLDHLKRLRARLLKAKGWAELLKVK